MDSTLVHCVKGVVFVRPTAHRCFIQMIPFAGLGHEQVPQHPVSRAAHPDQAEHHAGEAGLRYEGRPHSGLDDSRNIARIALRMLKDGCQLRVNERMHAGQLISVPSSAPLEGARPRSTPAPGTERHNKRTLRVHLRADCSRPASTSAFSSRVRWFASYDLSNSKRTQWKGRKRRGLIYTYAACARGQGYLLGLLGVLTGLLAAGLRGGGRAADLQVRLPQQPHLPLQLQQAPGGVAQPELRCLRRRLHLAVDAYGDVTGPDPHRDEQG
ncbi:3'-5' exoribonuclease 1 [Merluccius polli]|uniref:3'-5' exoribonuclease 1 n=1 Tax=Merluccius polli TaxID=89951 RepID=A0AA47N8H2_MERPO|nr:3'-5' exoribonuclease 1 [Merluccius polli]